MAEKLDLQVRLEEVMTALGWSQSELVQHSGASRSVVAQWLGQVGRGGHAIGKIANVEVALALQEASGYSAVWLALGKGPKKMPPKVAVDDARAELMRLYANLEVVGRARLLAYAADMHGKRQGVA